MVPLGCTTAWPSSPSPPSRTAGYRRPSPMRQKPRTPVFARCRRRSRWTPAADTQRARLGKVRWGVLWASGASLPPLLAAAALKIDCGCGHATTPAVSLRPACAGAASLRVSVHAGTRWLTGDAGGAGPVSWHTEEAPTAKRRRVRAGDAAGGQASGGGAPMWVQPTGHVLSALEAPAALPVDALPQCTPRLIAQRCLSVMESAQEGVADPVVDFVLVCAALPDARSEAGACLFRTLDYVVGGNGDGDGDGRVRARVGFVVCGAPGGGAEPDWRAAPTWARALGGNTHVRHAVSLSAWSPCDPLAAVTCDDGRCLSLADVTSLREWTGSLHLPVCPSVAAPPSVPLVMERILGARAPVPAGSAAAGPRTGIAAKAVAWLRWEDVSAHFIRAAAGPLFRLLPDPVRPPPPPAHTPSHRPGSRGVCAPPLR